VNASLARRILELTEELTVIGKHVLLGFAAACAASCLARAQQPASPGVAEILTTHDRALIRDLDGYLRKNPRADDRDQGYASLFNKAIEHDWFAETEQTAQRYLKDEPEGPVRALAQIITTMASAGAGRFDEALAQYRKLMEGLGKTDQEEFATSFSDNFAASALAAGEFEVARSIYQTLLERFPDSQGVREKVVRELDRLKKVGKPAPAFEVQELAGKTLRLDSLKGRYVLVDFWATWCAPCVAELPRLQEAYRKHHEAGLEIIGVSLDETTTAVTDFVKVRKLPWFQVHNGTAGVDLVEAFGVSAIPASYLISPEGNVVRLDLRGAALEATLAKLLKPGK
jgi:peroxiredoxin